jgi:hypothetical protein
MSIREPLRRINRRPTAVPAVRRQLRVRATFASRSRAAQVVRTGTQGSHGSINQHPVVYTWSYKLDEAA